jgi:hypothetical protein
MNIEELTWGGATDPCTFTTDTLTNGSLAITNVGGTKGTVTGSGTVITITIPNVTCLYGTGNGTHLGVLGSLIVNATLNELEPKKLLCPDTVLWTAEYSTTSPSNLRVEE